MYFYVIHATRALRVTTCRERELTLDHIHAFFNTQGHGEPPRVRYQLSTGARSETTRKWKALHTIHAPIHTNKVNLKGWLWWLNYIRGPCGPNASYHLSYKRGKPRKNLTPETCPDRGSNPGPLRDRRAYYHLLHSGLRNFHINWHNVMIFLMCVLENIESLQHFSLIVFLVSDILIF